MIRFADKVAIVTGGGSGIGRATAILLGSRQSFSSLSRWGSPCTAWSTLHAPPLSDISRSGHGCSSA